MADGVVVTGAGAVCPIAGDFRSLIEGMGRSAPATPRVEFDFGSRLTLNQARRLDRLSQLVLVAAMQAAEGARLGEMDGERVGIVVGTGLGCLERTESYLAGVVREGTGYADAMGFADSMDNAPAAHCAIALGCRGPSFTVSQREISGEAAVVLAATLLDAGAADAVLVAAGDSVSPGFRQVLARIAPGLTPGEGAGALVLERAGPAASRGASSLGRLLGQALTCQPAPRGRLRVSSAELLPRAKATALAMAGMDTDAREIAVISPDELSSRIGWCMADGVLRALVALGRLDGGTARAALVAGAARGGSAAALVLGPSRFHP